MSDKKYYAGIEAGGTKFVCAIADQDGQIVKESVIRTRKPSETMPEILEFFNSNKNEFHFDAMGVGCFGPLDLDKNSPTYGYITATPKLDWCDFNIVKELEDGTGARIILDTDVDVAARGEYRWGAGKGLDNFVYMTVGTGIGACAMVNGAPLQGMGHAEMGHQFVPQDKSRDDFAGICPYHHNCIEGLACGEAIKQRWQVESAMDLPPDHEAWVLEADYLTDALCNIIWTLSPERIILGGGVMKQLHLFDLIHARVTKRIAGYLTNPQLHNLIDTYIVPPGLQNHAGVMGAISIAM